VISVVTMVLVNEMVLTLLTSVGWVGAAGTVGAYALVSRGSLDASSMRFQAINVVGGGLLAISALTAGSWPSFLSNLIWMYFGVHALVRSRQALYAAVAGRVRNLRMHRDQRPTDPGSADEVLLAA
jgi:hypothetical protein